MLGSVLSRVPFSNQLSPLQAQVDIAVGGFVQQASDWRSLAAMAAGGVAYRAGRIGFLPSRVLSVGTGLTAEVSVFEITHRSLVGARSPRPQFDTSGTGGETPPLHPENPNLWKWSGPGGLKQGLLHSLVTFGTLKGMGKVAQGENLLVQHFLQDSAMVLGHQVSGSLGITPRPSEGLAEQFLHASATNLQLGAGSSFLHIMTPGLHSLERGLDLSLRWGGGERPRGPILLSNEWALAEGHEAQETRSDIPVRDNLKNPHVLMMASQGERKGKVPQTAAKGVSCGAGLSERELKRLVRLVRGGDFGALQRLAKAASFSLEAAWALVHLATSSAPTHEAARETAKGLDIRHFAKTVRKDLKSRAILLNLWWSGENESAREVLFETAKTEVLKNPDWISTLVELRHPSAQNFLKGISVTPFVEMAEKTQAMTSLLFDLELLAEAGNEKATPALAEISYKNSEALFALLKLAQENHEGAKTALKEIKVQALPEIPQNDPGQRGEVLEALAKWGNLGAFRALGEEGKKNRTAVNILTELALAGHEPAWDALSEAAIENPLAKIALVYLRADPP